LKKTTNVGTTIDQVVQRVVEIRARTKFATTWTTTRSGWLTSSKNWANLEVNPCRYMGMNLGSITLYWEAQQEAKIWQ
jgi:hypothetical protein